MKLLYLPVFSFKIISIGSNTPHHVSIVGLRASCDVISWVLTVTLPYSPFIHLLADCVVYIAIGL